MSYFKYDRHVEHWNEVLSDPDKKKRSETWFDKNTLDRWRHDRMWAPIRPIVECDIDASCLTVGDGRYGTDGNYILSLGANKVHCSDISDVLLKLGADKGFITDYSSQNAESLSFPDDSFDWVYCKESYHHFPRPYMALYEMVRVCKKGIILTEPRDTAIDRAPLSWVVSIIKKVLGRLCWNRHSFEKVGNYKYLLSERELEKFALGMHYRIIGFFGVNDSYINGVEDVRMDADDKASRALKKKIFRKVRILDFTSLMKLRLSNILIAVVFKEEPDESLLHYEIIRVAYKKTTG